MINRVYMVQSEIKGAVGLVLPLDIVRVIQKKERLTEDVRGLKLNIGGKGYEKER